MRVAVNLRLYVKGQIGGIENYVRHVIGAIATHQQASNAQLTVFAHSSQVDNVRYLAPNATIISVTHEDGTSVARRELERVHYDLLFCPLLVMDPLRVTGTSSVVTVPDIQHEFLPEFFDPDTLNWRRETFQPSVLYSDAVFTISEYSKSTIIDKFGADPAKIVVVGLDVDPEFRASSTAESQTLFEALGMPDRYIYYPANFWQHKNHSTLLRALETLGKSGHPDLHLVLTGAPGADMERVRSEAAALGLSERVRFLGYQPRMVLPELYRHSAALTFVSRFEGFGIPILEAFHTGVPAVTSASTSCPEVAGDAAVLVDELSPLAIAEGIRSVLEDPDLCRHLIATGRERSRRYTWKDTIETTLSVFESLADRGHRAEPITVNDHPVVSIVTPTYNMAHFLDPTIQSVLSQEYPHIDYVVMDGGSRDGTKELLQKYQARLRYVSAPDEGQADAINRGFELTHGKVFTFLNADDTYLPGAIITAVKALASRPEVGAVYGDGQYVRQDGSLIGNYPTRPFDYQAFSRNCFICQPAAFIRRHAFESAGKMNKSLHFALDYDLWIRMAKMFPIVKIEGCLATSRMYADNKTLGRRKQVYEEIIRVVKTHYGYVPYDWLYGYASYLIDRKDEIFEPGRQSPVKHIVALLLGMWHNPGERTRYWTDWSTAVGIGPTFTGRWEDGWISGEYDHPVDTGMGCDRIVIAGRHLAPFNKTLKLSILLDGVRAKDVSIGDIGPFRIEVPCVPLATGKIQLKLKAKSTFRPVWGGDARKLSCIIDSITAERSRDRM